MGLVRAIAVILLLASAARAQVLPNAIPDPNIQEDLEYLASKIGSGSSSSSNNTAAVSTTAVAAFTTTQTSLGVCYATVTMTTAGNCAAVWFSGSLYNTSSSDTALGILVNGDFPQGLTASKGAVDVYGSSNPANVSFLRFPCSLTAGTNKFCLTAAASAGTTILDTTKTAPQFGAMDTTIGPMGPAGPAGPAGSGSSNATWIKSTAGTVQLQYSTDTVYAQTGISASSFTSGVFIATGTGGGTFGKQQGAYQFNVGTSSAGLYAFPAEGANGPGLAMAVEYPGQGGAAPQLWMDDYGCVRLSSWSYQYSCPSAVSLDVVNNNVYADDGNFYTSGRTRGGGKFCIVSSTVTPLQEEDCLVRDSAMILYVRAPQTYYSILDIDAQAGEPLTDNREATLSLSRNNSGQTNGEGMDVFNFVDGSYGPRMGVNINKSGNGSWREFSIGHHVTGQNDYKMQVWWADASTTTNVQGYFLVGKLSSSPVATLDVYGNSAFGSGANRSTITATGDIQIPNAGVIKGAQTNGVLQNLAYVDSGNLEQIGSGGLPTDYNGSSITVIATGQGHGGNPTVTLTIPDGTVNDQAGGNIKIISGPAADTLLTNNGGSISILVGRHGSNGTSANDGSVSVGVNGGNTYLTVAAGGNVGIGTTSPSTTLDVTGSSQFGSGPNKSTFSTSGDLTFSNLGSSPSGASGRLYYDTTQAGGSGALMVALNNKTFVPIATGTVAGAAQTTAFSSQTFSWNINQTAFGVCGATVTINVQTSTRIMEVIVNGAWSYNAGGASFGLNVLQDGAFVSPYGASAPMQECDNTGSSITVMCNIFRTIPTPATGVHSYCLTAKTNNGPNNDLGNSQIQVLQMP